MTVAVIGAGIAGLAAANAILDAGRDVQVIEAGQRTGGLVHTELTDQGLLIDHGPDAIAATAAPASETLSQLGLWPEAVQPQGRAWLLQGRALQPLPEGLLGMGPGAGWEMLRSPLFSLKGKLRFALEPLISRRSSDEDESVAAFFERRFGTEMAERLVEPLLGGIYRCSTHDLSMKATMPHLLEGERRDGSITKSVLRTFAREPGSRRPRLVGLRGGMGTLTDRLARRLTERIQLGMPATALEPRPDGWAVHFANGSRAHFDAVVLAVPSWNAAELLANVDRDLAAELAAIRSSGVHSVVLAWPRAAVPHPLDGSGMLVPASAERPMAACTWVSEKWPGRAPSGVALMRVFLRSAEASDDELVQLAKDELSDVLGICSEPTFVKVLRHHRALPVYEVGHRHRVATLRARVAQLPGLALAGNAYDGVGMPACLASGRAAASGLAPSRATHTSAPLSAHA